MRVQLQHHFGWTTYEVDAPDLTSAAKAAVRQSHEFLTDDNHWMQDDDGIILVFREKDAVPPAVTPTWALNSFMAGSTWFCVGYREEPRHV